MADAARLRRAEPRLPPHPGGALGRGAGPLEPGGSARCRLQPARPRAGHVRGDGRRGGVDRARPRRRRPVLAAARRHRARAPTAGPRPSRSSAGAGSSRSDDAGRSAAASSGSVSRGRRAGGRDGRGSCGSGVRTASGIGRFLAGPGSPSLAGLLDGFSIWWASLGVVGQLGAVARHGRARRVLGRRLRAARSRPPGPRASPGSAPTAPPGRRWSWGSPGVLPAAGRRAARSTSSARCSTIPTASPALPAGGRPRRPRRRGVERVGVACSRAGA